MESMVTFNAYQDPLGFDDTDYSQLRSFDRSEEGEGGRGKPLPRKRKRMCSTPLIGESAQIKQIREMVKLIADTDSAVMITGESGTGKEVLASMIHSASSRAGQPYIRINCAALSESLLESELFGHEKGAFTGADRLHRGKFEIADCGTILLDEIGELSTGTQAKLLRVLQEKEVERVGGIQSIKTNFRLITSTNKELLEWIKTGKFREDLYYRINVIPIHLPPLRERRIDIHVLMDFFIKEFSEELHRAVLEVDKGVEALFEEYRWPGNVRELKNVIERMIVMCQGSKLTVQDIPQELKREWNGEEQSLSFREAKANFERNYVENALEKNDRNVARTALQLGIAKKSLYQKIKRYEL